MKKDLKSNKHIFIISISAILLFAAFFTSIFIYWNSLEFSQKYKFQLQKARSLLQDDYSKEVFDYSVDFMGSYPNFLDRHEAKFLELKNKEYALMRNPHVPISKGDTVIDGGVSVQASIEEIFYEIVGKEGRIIGFEPDINVIPSIKTQVQNYGNIEIYPYGLWKSNTRKKLWHYNFQLVNTIKKDWCNNYTNSKIQGYTYADLIKLDDFVKGNNIKRIDYIRLNIEGSELEALKGAKYTLKHLKPKLCITLEHHPTQLFSIILYLDSLNLGYKFYFGIHEFNRCPTLYANAVN